MDDLKKFKEESKETGKSEVRIFIERHLNRIYSMINNKLPRLERKTLNWTVDCGIHTTAGGDVTEEILNSEIEENDVAIVSLSQKGAAPVTLDDYEVQAGKIVITMSADPSNDHQLTYTVLRHSR
jgi:hypothetical protein